MIVFPEMAVIVTDSNSVDFPKEGAIPIVFPTTHPLAEATVNVVAPWAAIAVSLVETTDGMIP